MGEAPFGKLKPGPGLTPDAVFADQDRRLREALFELVAERGYDGVTLRGVSKLAGVSTHSFYRHFANLDEFFVSVSKTLMIEAVRGMASVSTACGDRRQGLREGVRVLMRNFASQPEAARLALVDAPVASPHIQTEMNAATKTFEQLVAELLLTPARREQVPRSLIAAMVAGTVRVARTTTMAGRAAELPGLADTVTDWALSLPLEDPAAPPSPSAESSPRRRRETYPFPDQQSRNGLAPTGDERERILRSVARLAAINGLNGLSIRRIRTEAGVSRRGFDACFSGVTDAFLEAIEWVVAKAAAKADEWAAEAATREERVHRLVLALCAQAARNSPLASMVFAGHLEAGREGLLRRERLLTRAACQLCGRPQAAVDIVAAEASVAAAWDIASAEAAAGRAQWLPQMAPLLATVALAPAKAPRVPAEAV